MIITEFTLYRNQATLLERFLFEFPLPPTTTKNLVCPKNLVRVSATHMDITYMTPNTKSKIILSCANLSFCFKENRPIMNIDIKLARLFWEHLVGEGWRTTP